ncbi:MAG: endonuclease/exonuclease/phosphatase family protein [Myxococcales bacterium]|nr:endonuclease/exonuclease/phosphatase family protein [Myxococcales bacterium]
MTPATTPAITLMTYNIRLGVETSLAAIARAIHAAGVPDILALQEIGDHWNMGERCDQTAAIARAIGHPHHVFAGALTDDTGGRYGIALTSRHAIEGITITRLPRGTDEQRVLLAATLRAPLGPIRVFVTHLSIHAHERLEQARHLAHALEDAARQGPVLLLGDLNDRPDTPTLATIRGPLTDLFETTGHGPADTFSVKAPHRRIDYLLCGGGLVPHGPARVVREATASDHFPLIGAVRLDHLPPRPPLR